MAASDGENERRCCLAARPGQTTSGGALLRPRASSVVFAVIPRAPAWPGGSARACRPMRPRPPPYRTDRWNDPAGESRAGGVAILTRAVDVVWEEGGPAPVIGSTLSQVALRIRSGVLQLEFYGGATVVAEGPAEIELKAIDRIACRSGKLRVQVPPSARGFRVESPAFDLVDLGTEFGMRVVPGQKSEVHVFNGKVELYETDPPSGQGG